VRKGTGSFNPNADTIKVLTMHISKGLEFPVVALMGVGQMPSAGDDVHEEARLFYVGATRATQRLVITASGDGGFGKKLATTITDSTANLELQLNGKL
jgi:superfamily I DNA/RNA helicase